MKLSEFENEKALELIADIIEPFSKLFTNENIEKSLKSGDKIGAIKAGLKEETEAVIEVLAAMNGVSVKDYHANVIDMTKQLLEILNDKDLVTVFQSQGQKME